MTTGVLAALAVALAASAAATAAPSRFHTTTFRFVDRSRRAEFSNKTSGPRVLVTEMRCPASGRAPFPLIVFAHGFAVTPDNYSGMLDAWAAAGYVVAAPEFPVERPGAPGGPARTDLDNEPGDISFLISRLTDATSPVRTLVDPTRIAVAGQSDGGVAALAVAHDVRHRDRRIDAAAVLSGAAPLGFAGAPTGAPPLLAMQGTADPINPPALTTYYFRLMRRPKFLAWVEGAPHREQYSRRDRWSPVVRATTIAFFDHYLRGTPLRTVLTSARRPGIARLVSDP